MPQRLRTLLGLSLLIGASLACSIGGDTAPASTAEPTAAATTPTSVSPTQVQIAVPTAIPTAASESLPTDTATPTLTFTLIPTLTPTPAATVLTSTHTSKPKLTTATATGRPVSAGPLTISYEAVGIKRGLDNQSVLTLKVAAAGGAGGYTYYNDDQKQAGAIFDVPGICDHPFVHTIKVTSADGQTATLPYFINGLCPSPTPTPGS
jgi:hypothetical protein